MPMRWHESILKVIDNDVTLAYVMAKVERTFLEGHTFQRVCRAKWRQHWCFTFFVDAAMSTPLACTGSQNKAGSHVGQHSFWCFHFFFEVQKHWSDLLSSFLKSLPTRFSRLVMTDQTSSFLFDCVTTAVGFARKASYRARPEIGISVSRRRRVRRTILILDTTYTNGREG